MEIRVAKSSDIEKIAKVYVKTIEKHTEDCCPMIILKVLL